MISPLNQSTHKKNIKLLPQGKEGSYKFNGRFVATHAAIEKFGEAVIVAAHMMLLKGGVRHSRALDNGIRGRAGRVNFCARNDPAIVMAGLTGVAVPATAKRQNKPRHPSFVRKGGLWRTSSDGGAKGLIFRKMLLIAKNLRFFKKISKKTKKS